VQDIKKLLAQKKVKVDMNNALDVKCDECGSEFFNTIFTIKKISSLVSPTGEDIFLPVQTFQCVECKHVNKDFN
jgi:hypothetical protein